MSIIVPLKSISTDKYDVHITMEIIPKKSAPRKPNVGHLEPIVSPKPHRPTVGAIMKQSSWSNEECKQMNDYELLAEFRHITGRDTLGCCHCGKKNGNPTQKPIEERWVHTIRIHTSKYGLYDGMPVPKTCDSQRVRNTLKNPISNPYYARLYNGPHMTEEERASFEEHHRQQLLSIDVVKRNQ
jgi:hypothetical protein